MSATPSPENSLSHFAESDFAFLKEIAAQNRSAESNTAHISSDDELLKDWSRQLRTAAFLDGFDPLALMPGISDSALQALLRKCTVKEQEGLGRWRLNTATRNALLAETSRDQAIGPIATAARAVSTAQGYESPFSRALVNLVLDGVPSDSAVADAGREMWAAYQAAVSSLRDSSIMSDADASKLYRLTQLAELLEPLRFLIGWDATKGRDAFIGRQSELRRLRTFVDVLESQGILESVHRGFNRVFQDESRAMFLSGIGGVGKSTLVAKFLVDHASTDGPDRLVFGYLDFDRASISGVQPATLLIEMLRQLSFQIPNAQLRLDNLREELQRSVAAVASSIYVSVGDRRQGVTNLPRELLGPSELVLYFEKLGQILRSSQSERVILIVLDTFEEVQLLGDEATLRVEGFIESLLRAFPLIRVLMAGRDEASGFFETTPRLPSLKGFGDIASRRAFLEARNVPRELSRQVADQAGGRPLALLLAARLVSEFREQSIDLSLMERFKSKLDEAVTEGVLYERILQHIPDERLRRIAHPGLVLRRLNSEIIVGVLAPALELGEVSAQQAEELLSVLRRQRDLVRVEADGSVTHRSDVRAQMLALMTLKDPVMVERLHGAAIDYYRSKRRSSTSVQEDVECRVEEIYHLLCLGRDLEQVVEMWIPAARIGLGRSVDEIPNPLGQLALRIMLNRTVGIAETKGIPPSLARVYAESATRSALSVMNPERAALVLDSWRDVLPKDLSRELDAITNDRNGWWVDAKRMFLGLSTTPRNLDSSDDVLARADFFERMWLEESERSKIFDLVFPSLVQVQSTVTSIVARIRFWIRAKQPAPSAIDSELLRLPKLSTDLDNRWLATIGDIRTKSVLRSFPTGNIFEIQRQQVLVLLSLCSDSSSAADEFVTAACKELISSTGFNAFEHFATDRSGGFEIIVRHLMRPYTPQWYAPLAASFRSGHKGTMPLKELIDPQIAHFFDIRLPEKIGSTRSLADVFRELDQLGLLAETVYRSIKLARSREVADISLAYDSWRKDLMRIDQEFGPRLSLHLKRARVS